MRLLPVRVWGFDGLVDVEQQRVSKFSFTLGAARMPTRDMRSAGYHFLRRIPQHAFFEAK
jgi:hypothetical protein